MNGNNERDKTKKRKKRHFRHKKQKNTIDNEISSLQSRYDNIDSNEINTFEDLPLSSGTLQGLKDSSYTVPTKIQKESIGFALQKHDILGAAKTGSGKTLAFLIPVLETLFCNKWSKYDGLGALIITPTRELALQIFETLRNIGRYHDFSAGLVIGGKDLKFEKSRMNSVNIIVATPGRLLQHMDENPLFNCDNLKILILDEADRCLDMGFEASMNAIVANLPPERQTLLFSATQTRSVRDLARLSLKDPKYISVHEHDKHKTPEGLEQSYIVCEQHEKMSVLWSFISSHLQSKVLVFFSTCHQVRYVHEVFRQLYVRTALLALHGKMHQLKRMEVYKTFSKKKNAVLFATDIAARGLDFPEVHWVIQMDCPEDVDTYIHRAGRTARYHKGGECLLLLCPSETAMAENLIAAKIPINQIKVNPAKMFSPQARIEALLAKQVQYKEMAQRAFVSYVKSVYLMKDKSIFDVKTIDLTQFSRSLGLVICPRVRFLQKHAKLKEVGEDRSMVKLSSTNDNREDNNSETDEGSSEYQSESELQEIELNSKQKEGEHLDFGLNDNEDDFLKVKRKDHDLPDDLSEIKELEEELKIKKEKKVKPKALAKKILKKKLVVNTKTTFNEEGEVVLDSRREKISEIGKDYEMNAEGGINIQDARKAMIEEDKKDRIMFREKMKAKKKEMKMKRREQLGLVSKKNEDVEASEEESGSESDGSGPDLSWLPDPDKIYGKQNPDDQSENSEEEEDATPVKKAKIMFDNDSESESEDIVSLRDEEEFALQLLSKNK